MPKELPTFLEVDGYYHAAHLVRPWADVVTEGVVMVEANALKVDPTGPASMGVQVNPGSCWVYRDGATWVARGAFLITSDAITQVAITANGSGNPRIDQIIAEVLDKSNGAASDDWVLRAVVGTPAGSPSAPATPNNAVALGNVAVAAGAASITAANITDVRPSAKLGGRLPLPPQLWTSVSSYQATTAYTLVLADANKNVEIDTASANTVTIPPNASVAFALGTVINVSQFGAGQTTIAPGAGVTLRAYNGNRKLAGQFAVASLIKRDVNDWWVAGNLVP